MKLSDNTLALLRNFSSIQENLAVRPGSSLVTISEAKTIVGMANISETFPSDFGIYDLKEFLSCLSLVANPDLEFSDKYVTIKDGRSRMRFFYSDFDTLTYPKKTPPFPDPEVTFKFGADLIDQIKKAAAVIPDSKLVIAPDDGKICATVVNPDNKTSNAFSVPLCDYQGTADFRFVFDVKNLKMMPGDYEVALSSKLITRFKSPTVTYFIAPESDSKYEG